MEQRFEVDGRRAAVAFRALQLGDLLVAVPALTALRRALPEHRLLLATSAWLEPVVRLVDAVDGLVPVGTLGEPLPFAPGEVDVVANLHGGGPESAGVVDAVGARVTIRHALAAGEPGPRWVEEQHERARWVRLTAAFGMPGDPDEVGIRRPDVASPAPGAAVVHVGAAYPSREWPADRFAAVARALEADGRRVVFSGSAVERARALDAAPGCPRTGCSRGAPSSPGSRRSSRRRGSSSPRTRAPATSPPRSAPPPSCSSAPWDPSGGGRRRDRTSP
jgi:hypothetical protein